MKKRLLVVAACLLGLGLSANAKKAPVTIAVVGGSGQVMVNGAPYVAGTPLAKGAKIQLTGAVTIKIGGLTIASDGPAALTFTGGAVEVASGSVQVTDAKGRTRTVAQGQSARVPPAGGAQQAASGPTPSPSATPSTPSPSPQQSNAIAPVSPSAP